MTSTLLTDRYQNILEPTLLGEIEKQGQLRRIPAGTTMIDIGDRLRYMPLVLDGAIKIVQEDERDHEYLLYYLETGDSCAMTMTCCLGNKRSDIRAVTEQDTTLYMIPVERMEEWLVRYKSWRAFVFDSYDVRMREMMEAVNVLAFHNMEERLYKYLRDRALVLGTPTLDITHYQIANDLNTSRVVVSRLMKKLAMDGRVGAERNQVTVLELVP